MNSNTSGGGSLGSAIAEYRKIAANGQQQNAGTKVSRTKLVENSKQKFYSNLGM